MTTDMENSNFHAVFSIALLGSCVNLIHCGKARWQACTLCPGLSVGSMLQLIFVLDDLVWESSSFLSAVSSELQETLCWKSRHTVPTILLASHLLPHMLNFMELVVELSQIMSKWNGLISPDGHLASTSPWRSVEKVNFICGLLPTDAVLVLLLGE